MTYYLDIARIDAYGRMVPYKGKLSFSSLTQARAALIRIKDKKSKGLVIGYQIYEGAGAAKTIRGRMEKYGSRWKWNDYTNDTYQYEVYKNGKIKKVWMW